jgi:7,8-dihydropterin-6-yl-methyl-4-(beta-D-ribofuranosyl)aminobenzene 5'-phosphate synthase
VAIAAEAEGAGTATECLGETGGGMGGSKMKISIIYDNEVRQQGLLSDWGFSCLVETGKGIRLLFDAGADDYILLHNMAKLNIDPASIDSIVISHSHFDHMGGLGGILKLNKKAKVFAPSSGSWQIPVERVIRVEEAIQIYPGIFSTGELSNIEQSLIINTDKGVVAIAGCSHCGVGQILNKASQFGQPLGIIGGLHGFRRFQLLADLQLVCPCHCTSYKREIKRLFPEKYIQCGAGLFIEL